MKQETEEKLQHLAEKQRELRWLQDVEKLYTENIKTLETSPLDISSIVINGRGLQINPHRPISKKPLISALITARAGIRKEIPAVEAEIEAIFNLPTDKKG